MKGGDEVLGKDSASVEKSPIAGRREAGSADRTAMLLVMVLLLAVSLLTACAQTPDNDQPGAPNKTNATEQPAAVAYATPEKLYQAIKAADAPLVSGLQSGVFSHSMPAGTRRAGFLAASVNGTLELPDGRSATSVVAALYESSADRDKGRRFGGAMAKALGWDAIWQLQGPNWTMWSIEEDALRAVRDAIGGDLSRAQAM